MIAKWLSEELLKTIVLFEIPDGKGGFTPHGTGVLLNYRNVFFLLTCKHIVINPQGSPLQDSMQRLIKPMALLAEKISNQSIKILN